MSKAKPSASSQEAFFPNPLLKGYPWGFRLHAVTALGLGTFLAVSPATLLHSPLWTSLSSVLGFPPVTVRPEDLPNWTNIGLFMAAFGAGYFVNAGEANAQGLKAARAMVRGRLVAAGAAAALFLFVPESRDLVKVLVMAEDGLMAIFTGWQAELFCPLISIALEALCSLLCNLPSL
jgi:hypothetical protein